MSHSSRNIPCWVTKLRLKTFFFKRVNKKIPPQIFFFQTSALESKSWGNISAAEHGIIRSAAFYYEYIIKQVELNMTTGFVVSLLATCCGLILVRNGKK